MKKEKSAHSTTARLDSKKSTTAVEAAKVAAITPDDTETYTVNPLIARKKPSTDRA